MSPCSQHLKSHLFIARKGIAPPPQSQFFPHICTLQRKSHLFIPRKGIVRPQSQFPHSCVCERSRSQAGLRSLVSAHVHCSENPIYLFPIKGQCHEIFCFWSFHESVSPQPQSIPLRPFQIFSKIRGDIRSSRFATVVNDTGGKWKKSSIRKILIILFGHLWVVEKTYV